MKKLLLTLGTIAMVVAPIATVVSCGKSTPGMTPPTDIPPVTPPTNQPPVTPPKVVPPVTTPTGTTTPTAGATTGTTTPTAGATTDTTVPTTGTTTPATGTQTTGTTTPATGTQTTGTQTPATQTPGTPTTDTTVPTTDPTFPSTVPTTGTTPTTQAPAADDFLMMNDGKIPTFDFDSPDFEDNKIVDKNGYILSWKPFEPVRSTKANSRHPDVTTPHPETKFAEPFTRTTGVGAMDVTGFKPGMVQGWTDETPKSTAFCFDKVAEDGDIATTVTPINVNVFDNIFKIFAGNLVIIERLNSTGKTGNTDNVPQEVMNALGFGDLSKLGIRIVTTAITREVHEATVMFQKVKFVTLKNVIFRLKGDNEFLPVDINILLKD